jgi:Lipopolysaccharide-assembly
MTLKKIKLDKYTRIASAFCFLIIAIIILGCGSYSFKGSTLSSDLKTIAINNFTLATAGGPANLSITLTEKLKEYYQRNTQLKLKASNTDLILEGSVVGYDLTPQAPTSQDKAGLNRLTITIQVHFTNNKDDEKSFEQNFSFYADFNQTQTLNQVEAKLIPIILDQIILDIFNKSAGDW